LRIFTAQITILHIRGDVIRKKENVGSNEVFVFKKTNKYPLYRFPYTIKKKNGVKIANFTGPADIWNCLLTREKWTGIFYFSTLSMSNIM